MKVLECQFKENGDYIINILFSREDRDKRKDATYRENQNKLILKEINKMLVTVYKHCD